MIYTVNCWLRACGLHVSLHFTMVLPYHFICSESVAKCNCKKLAPYFRDLKYQILVTTEMRTTIRKIVQSTFAKLKKGRNVEG